MRIQYSGSVSAVLKNTQPLQHWVLKNFQGTVTGSSTALSSLILFIVRNNVNYQVFSVSTTSTVTSASGMLDFVDSDVSVGYLTGSGIHLYGGDELNIDLSGTGTWFLELEELL
jgi:hypothetical protein